MLERRRGTYAELAFLPDVRAGRYTLLESLSADLERIAELVAKYDDLPLGTVIVVPLRRTRLRRMVSNPETRSACSQASPTSSPRRAPVTKVSQTNVPQSASSPTAWQR